MGVEPDVDFGVVFVAPRAFLHDLGLFYGFEAVAVGGFKIGLGICFFWGGFPRGDGWWEMGF